MFFKIGSLKNLAIFTGKQLCWGLFLIKLQAFRLATFLKRDSNIGVFPVGLAEFLRTTFSYRTPPVAASESPTAAQ